jgi:predicted nucleic acid-binding protein
MNAVDTNVLIYAKDARYPQKQNEAISLIDNLQDGVLLWQVACEFMAASHKLAPLGYNRGEAWKEVQRLRLIWHTAAPDWQVLDRAELLFARFSLSQWDAMLVAACLEVGVTTLYSEDLTAYPRIDTLQILNPFTP